MAIVRQNGLSADEAESYLARVWRILEEFEIASPQVRIDDGPDGSLDISLAFDSLEEAALLARTKLAAARIVRPHAAPMSAQLHGSAGAHCFELDG